MRKILSVILVLSSVILHHRANGSDKVDFDLYCFMLKDADEYYDPSNILIDVNGGEVRPGRSGFLIYKEAFSKSPPEFPLYIGLDVENLEENWFFYPLIYEGDSRAAVLRIDIITNKQSLEEIDGYYAWPEDYHALEAVSPDGRYLYLSTETPADIYFFEHNDLVPSVNSEVWLGPFVHYISKYNIKDKAWERLTHDYSNFGSLVSSDGLFLVYTRKKGSSKESVFCRSDGWFKVVFDVPLGLKSTNYFFLGKNLYLTASPSLSRVINETDNEYTYYFATPYFTKYDNADEAISSKYRWLFIRFSVPDYVVKYDHETAIWYPGSGLEYEIKADVVDLELPFSEFDYVLDVRFRSDGRYVSLVGAKDDIRKLYIYDLEEEELHEVEGSEGALTARWLEIIE